MYPTIVHACLCILASNAACPEKSNMTCGVCQMGNGSEGRICQNQVHIEMHGLACEAMAPVVEPQIELIRPSLLPSNDPMVTKSAVTFAGLMESTIGKQAETGKQLMEKGMRIAAPELHEMGGWVVYHCLVPILFFFRYDASLLNLLIFFQCRCDASHYRRGMASD
jgi:hypothetical protein